MEPRPARTTPRPRCRPSSHGQQDDRSLHLPAGLIALNVLAQGPDLPPELIIRERLLIFSTSLTETDVRPCVASSLGVRAYGSRGPRCARDAPSSVKPRHHR